jgi:hypothetical protein
MLGTNLIVHDKFANENPFSRTSCGVDYCVKNKAKGLNILDLKEVSIHYKKT